MFFHAKIMPVKLSVEIWIKEGRCKMSHWLLECKVSVGDLEEARDQILS